MISTRIQRSSSRCWSMCLYQPDTINYNWGVTVPCSKINALKHHLELLMQGGGCKLPWPPCQSDLLNMMPRYRCTGYKKTCSINFLNYPEVARRSKGTRGRAQSSWEKQVPLSGSVRGTNALEQPLRVHWCPPTPLNCLTDGTGIAFLPWLHLCEVFTGWQEGCFCAMPKPSSSVLPLQTSKRIPL